ncbi:hypothetical protein ACFOMD_17255 [Sphingoaurantiacus capsulatus]|uniref:Uncharacterized protein n=1 Tax=Sphingoaurantiacus capsulatus TaxID=1771310 RepID=A0ABV7XFU1_9SPHN
MTLVNFAIEAPPKVTLQDWLGNRRPSHLSTNTGSELVAFQSWRKFKEAFAPELIAQAFEETEAALGRPVLATIDPFGGSGTTALSSQFLAARPCTVEVNPYLADLIEAKLASYDASALLADLEAVIEAYKPFRGDTPFPGAPSTFVEPGINKRYIFNREVANTIAGLREAILAITNVENRRLLRVVLASICVPVSNVVVSGKGRRYRRNWSSRKIKESDVTSMFYSAGEQAVDDVLRYRNRLCLDYDLIRGDARENIPEDRQFDVAIFSPPYPNSFDYTDVYNVELWAVGYLAGASDNRALRLKTLRSHVQIKRPFDASDLKSNTLKSVYNDLDIVRSELWNQSIPDMVVAYFDDMHKIMTCLFKTLVKNGRVYAVVGDSRYNGVYVPVAKILTELAIVMGFSKISEEPFRSMRASPQQGGKKELKETLLVFSK